MSEYNNGSEVARDNYAAYAYSRDTGHLEFVEKARICDEFFKGNQWDEAIRCKLEGLGKPVITINKVLSTMASIWGEQLSHRADVAFRPTKGGSPETAATMDKLWIHTTNTNDYDWIEAQMAAEAFIRSRGFVDVRCAFDDQMQGEVRYRLLNGKNVLPDPDASSYDPDDWGEVIITKWLSRREVELMWGNAAAEEVSRTGQAMHMHRYDTADWIPDTFGGENLWGGYDGYREGGQRQIYRFIERQHREARYADHFVNAQTGDIREIPETWDRNRIARVMEMHGLGLYRKKVDKIRWTTSTDSVTMHDAISPYKHFTPVPFFPFFLHGTTIGVVENMLDPQQLLNKSISQELHVINTTANSGWVIKDGALVAMTSEELEERGAEDGLVLSVRNDVNTDVKKITPNQIPQGLDRVSFKADEALKEVSMVSDSMRGFDRADVAAKAIRAKQARGTVSLASPFNNLDKTRHMVARNTLDLWQYYYTEERVLQITSKDLSDEPEEIVINRIEASGEVINDLTIGEYAVRINTVPARESYEETQFQEAMEMRREGIAVPDDIIVEHSHLNRKGEIAKRIKALNGGEEPTVEQQQLDRQVQEIEMRQKAADAEEAEAKAQLAQANAALAAARTRTEMITAGNDTGAAEIAMEREKAASEMQIKRMTALADIQLEREKADAELRLAKEKQAAELEMAQDESKAKQKMLAAPKPPTKTGDRA